MMNNAGIFVHYDQLGKEVNGGLWPVCVISTYPKDELPEFSIGHCRPSGRYTKNECCEYGYAEITDTENCKRGLSQFPWDFEGTRGVELRDILPAAWEGEVEVNDYPFGCYARNHDKASVYPRSNRYPLQGFLNKKTPQGNMVSGHLAAIPVCRRLDYGFEGEYYASRDPEDYWNSKKEFVICTIKQTGPTVNVDCPGIPSMRNKRGIVPNPKVMVIEPERPEQMQARRFGTALRFSKGWVWERKTNKAALEDSR